MADRQPTSRGGPEFARTYRDSLAEVASVLGAPKRKLAEAIADRIERDIVSRGWPVGTVIGSESELLAEYGVGRSVLREAIRLLEHHSVAVMRQGPGGGLVVTAPNLMSVAEAIALYLEYHAVSPAELFEARKALELTCVQMVVDRLDESGIARLRSLVAADASADAGADAAEHTHDWHIVLAELSGNAAIAMLVTILARLTRERERLPDAFDTSSGEVREAHARVTEAIIEGDVGLAKHRLVRHLDWAASFMDGGRESGKAAPE
jgi:DNA-binding FadR family transcriptional regulator